MIVPSECVRCVHSSLVPSAPRAKHEQTICCTGGAGHCERCHDCVARRGGECENHPPWEVMTASSVASTGRCSSQTPTAHGSFPPAPRKQGARAYSAQRQDPGVRRQWYMRCRLLRGGPLKIRLSRNATTCNVGCEDLAKRVDGPDVG